MKILVCGSRDWKDSPFIYRTLDHQREVWSSELYWDAVIEGDCRGADKMAGNWARARGITNIKFPALWSYYGKKAGMLRNKAMLLYGQPDLVIAFHDKLDESSGTKMMIDLAVEKGIPFEIYKH